MIYQLNIIASRDRESEVEEILYDLVFQGWETLNEGDLVVFRIYLEEMNFNESEVIKDLEKALAKYLDVRLEYVLVEERNWVEIWKESFKPVEVGEALVIVPPWIDPKTFSGKNVIFIEPGQAFGTGHHATTQMMLKNIEIFSKGIPSEEKLYILDLGCGTGILAITCAKLLPNSKVWAVDIDEEAIKACHLNISLNKVEHQIRVTAEIPDLKFDLILANIGYKELKKLAPRIKELSEKGKTMLFLSGILNEDAEEIRKTYENLGFKLIKIDQDREWTFFCFKL